MVPTIIYHIKFPFQRTSSGVVHRRRVRSQDRAFLARPTLFLDDCRSASAFSAKRWRRVLAVFVSGLDVHVPRGFAGTSDELRFAEDGAVSVVESPAFSEQGLDDSLGRLFLGPHFLNLSACSLIIKKW